MNGRNLNKMLKIVKHGEIYKSKGHTQYPAPILLKDSKTGQDFLRIFYTDREDNKSIPCFTDFETTNFNVLRTAEKVLPLGKPGEFDEDGISIQFQSNTTVWYTGYTKGISTPYRTMIGTAEWSKNGELRKTGICLGISRRNPLSVCTPCITNINGKFIFFYNTHTGWDIQSDPKEAFYRIVGQAVQDPWSPAINAYEECFMKGGTDHSYARPWAINFKGKNLISYCYRSNYEHREDPTKTYKTMFYDWSTRRTIPHEQVNMEDEFMVAYLTSCNIKDKTYVFWNSSYDSGIQYGELLDE